MLRLLALLVALILIARLTERPAEVERIRRPSTPVAVERLLPVPSSRDPVTIVQAPDCRGTCTGTAFAVDGRGNWLTAGHVVNGCKLVALVVDRTGNGEAIVDYVQQIRSAADADISLLHTSVAKPPLAFARDPIELGEDGFHFGFPQGRPGAIYSRLIGRTWLRHGSLAGVREPSLAWAEVSRAPANDDPLGGLSGGPVLNEQGRVVGVAVAASMRRGRILSATPTTVTALLTGSDVVATTAVAAGKLGAENYASRGTALREELRVAQVICIGYRRVRRPAL